MTFLTGAGLLVVWVLACERVWNHHVTVGVLTAFLAYIARFYGRMESMIRMASATQRAAASAQRIFEILDRKPSVPEPVRPVHPGRVGMPVPMARLTSCHKLSCAVAITTVRFPTYFLTCMAIRVRCR